jgi:hypothetical protein
MKSNLTFKTQWAIAPAWPSLVVALKGRGGMRGKAKSLTNALFSLDEPWQGRFLNLVADLATNSAWDGRRPTRKEVMAWLGADLELYREVKLLLDAWQRPGR